MQQMWAVSHELLGVLTILRIAITIKITPTVTVTVAVTVTVIVIVMIKKERFFSNVKIVGVPI